MNARIEFLAEKAIASVETRPGTGAFLIKDFQQAFAELIIQDCIKIVQPSENHRAWAQGYVGGVDGVELLDYRVEAIKGFFGVK